MSIREIIGTTVVVELRVIVRAPVVWSDVRRRRRRRREWNMGPREAAASRLDKWKMLSLLKSKAPFGLTNECSYASP